MHDISSGEMNTEKSREEEGHARDLQNKIIAAVARFYKISIKEMKRRTRKASVAAPRKVAIYLIRDMTGLSYLSIGRLFGLDHSTAIHAYQKIERNRSADARLDNDIQQIADSIQRELSQ
jgi:chromosomal replication initiator protein